MSQKLSSKEASLFRQIVTNYETKQYKKGLKAAEQVLKKVPNHGETQAMKALLLSSLGQTDEAFALAKVALKNDMKSHVCWHVYGLIWRSAKNFEEATKAYKFALKLQPDSVQILRDLAMLQVQMRDYQGYVQSRKLMLQGKSSLRQNWTALAIAHHLAGNLEEAEKTLVTYEETLKSPPPKTDIEHSEAVIFKNTIIAERGDTQRALEHLEAVEKRSLDRTAVMEMRAQYLLKLDRKSEAERAYRALLERNTEYGAYYEGLEKALDLSRTDKQALKELYSSYAQKHDRLDAARRIPLDFLDGDDFRAAAGSYISWMLEKNVPSTFNNIKALYSDKSKRQIIEEVVEGFASINQINGNGDGDAHVNGDGPDKFKISALYFLAQHYNYKLSRNLEKAMQYAERLIDISPKTYDYHMTKARIQKHTGDVVEAAKTMNYARELDVKDRYINTKCAKYQLRNNDNNSALQTMSKFTRNETIGGTLGDLLEMQCLWYLTEDGEACSRQGKLGLALKRFHSILDIFAVWEEDQFDFHSFSLRKGQIRAYMDLIRWEDRLREHSFYTRAAIDAVKIYLALYDKPHLSQDGLSTGFADLDDAERKKALKKAKKEQEKMEREDAERREADRKAAAKKSNASAEGEVKKVDQDPRGTKLLETKDPLDVATKILEPVLEFGGENAEAQRVGFEIYLRRRKYYLALRCLLASFKSNSADHSAHEQVIRLRHTLKADPSSTPEGFLDLANSTLPSPYNDSSTPLSSLNADFLASHSTNATAIFCFAKARNLLDPSTKGENEEAVLKVFDTCEHVELGAAIDGIELLRELGSSKEVLRRFVKVARRKWPDASVLEMEVER